MAIYIWRCVHDLDGDGDVVIAGAMHTTTTADDDGEELQPQTSLNFSRSHELLMPGVE